MGEQIIEARENLRWLGLIGLISGLVTVISFFFLPWFRRFGECSGSEAFCSSLIKGLKGTFGEATGLAVANGGYSYTYGGSTLVFSFPLLWALVLVSVILLVLSILVVLSKVVARKGARAIQIICGVALAVVALAIEVIFMGSAYAAPTIAGVQGIDVTFSGLELPDAVQLATSFAGVHMTFFDASGHLLAFYTQETSPSFGFWLALLATLGGMVSWIVTLYRVSDSGVLPYGPTSAVSPSGAPLQAPSPSSDYGSPPYGVPLQNPYEQLIPPPPRALRTRTVGGTILSVFFYLWGIFCLSLGLIGGVLLYAPSSILRLGVVANCIVGLVILILLLLLRKRLYLSTRRRLWLEIGLLLIGVLLIVTVLAAVPSSSPTAQNIALGSVIVIYGLIAAIVAYW